MKPLPQPLAGVFFDLDGTLVDSARDLHDALTALCREYGIPVPAFEVVRESVSRGSRAILRCALGNDEAAIDAVMPRFIALYVATGMVHTHAFAGVDALLGKLEAGGVPWGIVSNKAAALVALVLEKLGYDGRAAAVVGGDTLPQRKPDPAPVLHACAMAEVAPAQSVYVGDDPRDVVAGRAAGLYTVAAAWGYLDGADPRDWQPDAISATPGELATLLDFA
ncbi:MAG: Phosphoglycolate phosphatase [Rhodanobacteraceae bacterium]|jgi:phosphoglycolate phosphatase|nr:MAG: Phosphoglycolate phosphatase [Rhodanobacteraceae bacterium]